MRFVWLCLLALPPALAADQVPFLTPSSLSFVYQIGSFQPGSQAVILSSPIAAVVSVPRVANANWLLLAGTSTSLSANRPVLFEIGIDPRGLGPGSYSANVNFQTGSVTQTVRVTLQVTAGVVLISSPGIGILDVISAPAGVNPVQTIAVGTSNGTPLLMSATTTSPWLAIKATGSTIQISTDRTKAPGGLSVGFVTATSTNSTINPLIIPVVVLTQPAITRIVNAATFQDGPIAPGQIITLGGPNAGPATLAGLSLDSSGNVATSVSGTQVLIDGTPAPLVYTSNTLISAVVPYEVAGKASVSVQVIANGIISNTLSQTVAAAVPGLFTSNASGQGAGAILNSDSSYNSPSNPAAPGSTVVLYATGEGQIDPQGITGKVTAISALTPKPVLPVTVQIDGQAADILFAGEAPGFVSGFFQVNVRIPAGARSGALPVVLSVGSSASPGGVTLSVR